MSVINSCWEYFKHSVNHCILVWLVWYKWRIIHIFRSKFLLIRYPFSPYTPIVAGIKFPQGSCLPGCCSWNLPGLCGLQLHHLSHYFPHGWIRHGDKDEGQATSEIPTAVLLLQSRKKWTVCEICNSHFSPNPDNRFHKPLWRENNAKCKTLNGPFILALRCVADILIIFCSNLPHPKLQRDTPQSQRKAMML